MVQTLQLLAVLALCQVGEVLFPNLADLESPTPRDISTEAETNCGAVRNSTLFQPWTPAAPGKVEVSVTAPLFSTNCLLRSVADMGPSDSGLRLLKKHIELTSRPPESLAIRRLSVFRIRRITDTPPWQ